MLLVWSPLLTSTQLSSRVCQTLYLLLSGWSTLHAVHLFLFTSSLLLTFLFLTLPIEFAPA